MAAPAEVAQGETGWCRLILSDREVVLGESENVLGRSHHAAVWLPATGVSRLHARIMVSGAHAELEDLASKNGTFWRGTRISAPTALADGDPIPRPSSRSTRA